MRLAHAVDVYAVTDLVEGPCSPARVRTWTSTSSSATSASLSCGQRGPPASTIGGYSHDTTNTRNGTAADGIGQAARTRRGASARGGYGLQLGQERGDRWTLLRTGADDREDLARQRRVERAQLHLRRCLVVSDLGISAMPTPRATSAAMTAKSLLKPTMRGSGRRRGKRGRRPHGSWCPDGRRPRGGRRGRRSAAPRRGGQARSRGASGRRKAPRHGKRGRTARRVGEALDDGDVDLPWTRTSGRLSCGSASRTWSARRG